MGGRRKPPILLMPISSVQEVIDAPGNAPVGFDINTMGRELKILFADIPGNGWPKRRLDKLVEDIQSFLDVLTPLQDLPDDDPDKTTDPGLATLFWDGPNLVARHTTVSAKVVDGSPILTFTRVQNG